MISLVDTHIHCVYFHRIHTVIKLRNLDPNLLDIRVKLLCFCATLYLDTVCVNTIYA